MNKLQMYNDMVLVEQFDKLKKKSNSSPFTSVTVSNNLGTVKYSDNPLFPVGSQIYYGGQFEKIMVEDHEVLAMKASNIIAKIID